MTIMSTCANITSILLPCVLHGWAYEDRTAADRRTPFNFSGGGWGHTQHLGGGGVLRYRPRVSLYFQNGDCLR